jgi:hypothetical protein
MIVYTPKFGRIHGFTPIFFSEITNMTSSCQHHEIFTSLSTIVFIHTSSRAFHIPIPRRDGSSVVLELYKAKPIVFHVTVISIDVSYYREGQCVRRLPQQITALSIPPHYINLR